MSSSLARHDFLYAGEWQNESFAGQNMHLVQNGALAWTWTLPWDGEFGDISLLPGGDVVFAWFAGIARIDRFGRVLWRWEAPADSEVHTCQPLGADRLFVVINGYPSSAIILRMSDRSVEWTAGLRDGGGHRHGKFRHCRLTSRSTLLIAHLDLDRVVEYDLGMRELLTIETESPWAAVPVQNGRILVSGDAAGYLAEFDGQGVQQWAFDRARALQFGIEIHNVQQAQRLHNGSTVFANWSGNHLADGQRGGTAQLVEINSDEVPVWVLSEWEDPDLGVASNLQILEAGGAAADMQLR